VNAFNKKNEKKCLAKIIYENDQADPTFNQLLGINDKGSAVGFYKEGRCFEQQPPFSPSG
jgi:hypothetical protein